MTIAVGCQCGKRFAAKPELAGKRVKCPACGQALTVPGGAAPQAVSASAPAASPVVVTCECGGRFQAGPHLIGKQVACPRCKRTLSVQNPAAVAANNSFGTSANDPLGFGSQDMFATGGTDAWTQGGALGGPTYPAANTWPATHAAGTPRAAPAKGGVPIWIWIIAGVGGAACLLLICGVVLLSMFRPRQAEPAGDAAVADSSSATSSSATTSSSSASASSPVAAAAAPPPKVDDARVWNWKPGPWPAISAGSQQPIALKFRPYQSWFSSVGVPQAIVSPNPYESRPEPGFLLQRWDLATGQMTGECTLEKNSELVGAAPDCSSFLMFSPAARYDHDRFQLWQWSGSTAKMVKEFQPYQSKTKHETRIASYLLASSSCVLTKGTADKFPAAWDATTGNQMYRLPEAEIGVTVAPQHNTLVHTAGVWMRLFDVKTGEHRGSIGPIPTNYYSVSAASVSPSGQLLATVIFRADTSSYVLAIWNLADRKQVHEIRCSGATYGVLWCGEEFLIVGDLLISLQHQRPVWRYQPSPMAVAGDGACWFQLGVGNENYVYSGKAPSPEVISGIDEFLARDVVRLKSGDSISLDFQVTASQIPADSESSKLQQLLKDNLQKSGYAVADGQEFKLQVAIKEEDTGQTLPYESFMGGSKTTFRVPQRLLKCSAVMTNSQGETTYDEKATYQTGGFGGIEFNAPNNEAEFAKLLLDRRWKGVQDWLNKLVFPQEIRAYSGIGKYPTSRVEPAGETINRVGG